MNKVKRIGLTHEYSSSLETISNDLKKSDECLKYNDSELVGVILEVFLNKYYKKEKSFLIETFFDQRKALLQMMKDSKSKNDLEESLSLFLKKKNKSTSKIKKEKC